MAEETFIKSKQFDELSEEIKKKLEDLKKAKIKESKSGIFGKILEYSAEIEEIDRIGITKEENYYVGFRYDEIIKLWIKFLEYYSTYKLKSNQYLFWEYKLHEIRNKRNDYKILIDIDIEITEKINERQKIKNFESFYIYTIEHIQYDDGYYDKLYIELPPIFEL